LSLPNLIFQKDLLCSRDGKSILKSIRTEETVLRRLYGNDLFDAIMQL
jgi:hypothetical protein